MSATVGATHALTDGFATLFERHPQPSWAFDLASHQLLAANDAARARYGYESEEMLALHAEQLHPGEDAPLINTLCERLKGGGTELPGPAKFLTKNSVVIEGTSTWCPVEFAGRAAVLVVANHPDRAIVNAGAGILQGDLLDLSSDAVIICDLAGTVKFWNQSATRVYGWRSEEAIGKSISPLLTQDAAISAAIESNVRSAGQWKGQLQHVARDGRAVVVSSSWTLIRETAEEPARILIINSDLTETKNLEAQFLRAQRLESIGTLASGIAHDLNNILSPIVMSVGLLRRSMKSPEEEKLLAMIESSAERGAGIVQQVLTFARGIDGERVLLQPKHLVHEVGKNVSQTFPANLEVRTQTHPEMWTVLGDAGQLKQVLMNLCLNARDAMPDGGTLTISADNFQVDHHFARINPGAQIGDHVLLTVADTGYGISAELMEKIFDPFFTTKKAGKGTGLGLATVVGIVKSHGGFISVQSEVGQGTTVRIYVPASRQETLSVSGGTETAELLGRGELILVVDDEAAIREAIVQTLQDYGYRAYTAEDGSEALALYVQRKEEIDVVLTDLAMDLMDGVALSRSLKRFDPDARIVVSTGHCSPEQRKALKEIGVRAILEKPYNAAKLLVALRETLKTEVSRAGES